MKHHCMQLCNLLLLMLVLSLKKNKKIVFFINSLLFEELGYLYINLYTRIFEYKLGYQRNFSSNRKLVCFTSQKKISTLVHHTCTLIYLWSKNMRQISFHFLKSSSQNKVFFSMEFKEIIFVIQWSLGSISQEYSLTFFK